MRKALQCEIEPCQRVAELPGERGINVRFLELLPFDPGHDPQSMGFAAADQLTGRIATDGRHNSRREHATSILHMLQRSNLKIGRRGIFYRARHFYEEPTPSRSAKKKILIALADQGGVLALESKLLTDRPCHRGFFDIRGCGLDGHQGG